MKLPSPKRAAAIFMLLLLTVLVTAGFTIGRNGERDIVLLDWELKWAHSGRNLLPERQRPRRRTG